MQERGSLILFGNRFIYEVTILSKKSKLGLRNGRISKLQVVKDKGREPWIPENMIIDFDGKWHIRPQTEVEKLVLKYITAKYN